MAGKAVENIKAILEENRFLRTLVQDALDYGRIYHHQKRKLEKRGFKIK